MCMHECICVYVCAGVHESSLTFTHEEKYSKRDETKNCGF